MQANQPSWKSTKFQNLAIAYAQAVTPKKKATAAGQWPEDMVANQGFEPRTCGL